MTTRTKRWLLLATALFLIGGTLVGWTAVKMVAWVRDLPNRIVIDTDAAAAAFRGAVTESFHSALGKGESSMQLQVINEQFIPMIKERPETATWIRDEYRSDILALVDSDDAAVSAAASDLISRLDAVTKSPDP